MRYLLQPILCYPINDEESVVILANRLTGCYFLML